MVRQQGSQSRSVGTTITVRNLFRKIPARLKFLKSTTTENSHIANVVSQYALAFPEVKFALSVDGRVTLRTPGSGKLIDSIAQIYGLEIARSMLPIEGAEWESGAAVSPPQVTGAVSSPTVSRSNRNYLSFFVNRRWINSRSFAWAVEEAYHGLLMEGRHPVAVINISIPPDAVDVNVHPTKTEIKFQNERTVFVALQRAVRQTLVNLMPVPRIEEVATAYRSPSMRAPLPGAPARSNSLFGPFTASSIIARTPGASLPVLRVLGQVLSSYIVAEGPEGLYIIDQHAAHERILWEKIHAQRQRHEVEVQGLLESATLEVSPRQDEVLRSHHTDLAEFGFSIEPFGNRTYLVRAVPALLNNKDWTGMLREMMDLTSGGDRGDWTERVTVSMACHSAVRAGQILAHEEMRELVRELEQTAVPNTCPHGRPTMIHLSSAQLRKEFGRE
ncbi:DNA mismatch repair protein MutL [subsurface metagenome]